MIIDLENLRERNCSNCFWKNTKYKILTCKIHNRQINPNHCCQAHCFDDEVKEKSVSYMATCPRCDNDYEIEEEQSDIYCPYCHYEIDWELDQNWIKKIESD